jgi:hypothetical protein
MTWDVANRLARAVVEKWLRSGGLTTQNADELVDAIATLVRSQVNRR